MRSEDETPGTWIRLIHWHAAEARVRAERLEGAGFRVVYDLPNGPDLLRELRADPPAAVVVDLSRLPSHGREIALGLRQHKATRGIPLVFAGGEPEKVARVRDLLPDAVFADWDRIAGSLREAIAIPPAEPVVPRSVFAAYEGTPLPKKLGMKANAVVALVSAPEGFWATLGDLPEGVSVYDEPAAHCDLTLWFVRSRDELLRDAERIVAQAKYGPVWIVWPKKTAGTRSDLREQHVRETGLAAGLVDYKICALDATWSGLLFRRRQVGRPALGGSVVRAAEDS